MTLISDKQANAIGEIFGRDKALIGMIHVPPLPGAPRHRDTPMAEIIEACLRDAEALIMGGLHGLIVENHGDIPFRKPERIGPETAACLAVIADRLTARFDAPVGINVLANAAIPALAVAVAAEARFIRVNQWANAYVANEGFIEGEAAEALRYRAALHADHVKVFADSHVKHGAHAITADRNIEELTRDLAFFDADAVIATGQRTGDSATIEEIDTIAAATHLPLLVGSGVNPGNIAEILSRTQGVIVASALKVDGLWWNPVEPARVSAFLVAARPALEG